MAVSVISLVTGVAVVTLGGFLGWYCWCRARRRRRWQARWAEFASRYAGLDRELEHTWDHLRR